MTRNYYTKALKLINNKPTITQMVDQGYQAYAYPQPTIDYACKVLNARELKLYLQISGQANGFSGAMKFYSDKANIKSNHYSEILESLVKKGFIKHIKYESIEVLYPTEKVESQNRNQVDSTTANILQKRESTTQKGNTEEQKRKNDSLICGYNRETEINKEINREILSKENEYEEKIHLILNKIGARFNITDKVYSQLKELKTKGFSNEFIFYALENKNIGDFSMGIGLLFKETYQKEIQAKISQKKEQLKRILESIDKSIEERKKISKYRTVKMPEPTPITIPRSIYSVDSISWEEEPKEEKISLADMI